MPKCLKCGDAFPNLLQVEGKMRNVCKRKYCLRCSPFGLHNTRKMEVERPNVCLACNNPNDNSGRICQVCNTKIARWRLKLALVIAKGAKCERCNWVGNPVAFDFHHLDPKEKEMGLNMTTVNQATMLREVEKCILLCARYHRLEHAEELKDSFWEQVFEYRGALDIGGREDWKFLDK